MSTMSEDTVRVHEVAKEIWRGMAQEMIDKHGGLEDLVHMAQFNDGLDLLYSCTVHFADQQQMRDGLIVLGMLLGTTPDVKSVTLHFDTVIKDNHDLPHLVGENALSTMTLEVDRIGDAVLFERRSSLNHYIVTDGLLRTEEVIGATGSVESGIYDVMEQAAGEAATGHTYVTDDNDIESYLPMLQLVDYAMRELGWSFLPSETFELAMVDHLLNNFGPTQFADARKQHGGFREMTPRVAVIDGREQS